MRQMASREFYRILHRLADAHVGRVESAFLRAIAVAARDVDRAALAAALQRGDVRAAFDAVGLNGQIDARLRDALATALRSAFVEAGVATAAATPLPGVEGVLRFDLTNPRAMRWARLHAARRVRQITGETKKIIRDHVARGFDEGITVRRTAQALRPVLLDALPHTLGLTATQYRAVVRMRDSLVEAGESASTIERKTAAYAAKQLRRRALTIARTETIAASSAGQQELWEQAREAGYLDTATTRRLWLVTPDDRLCPICEEIPGLNTDGVSLDAPFATPEGPCFAPPAHPNCRCAVSLDVDAERAPVRNAA